MSLEPEENPLDQSLREVFRDYDLPPAEHPHVWENVARQLNNPLSPNSFGLVRRVGLPALGALGLLAGGWLLVAPAAPEPATRISTQLPPSAEPATLVASAPAAAPLPPPTATEPAAELLPLPLPKPAPRKRRIAATSPLPQPAAPDVPVSAVAATPAADRATHDGTLASVGQQAASPVEVSDPAPAVPQPPATAPNDDSALLATVATGHTPKAVRYKENEENGFKYHKPTHRLAEPGTGFQRWLGRLKKNVRQLVGKE